MKNCFFRLISLGRGIKIKIALVCVCVCESNCIFSVSLSENVMLWKMQLWVNEASGGVLSVIPCTMMTVPVPYGFQCHGSTVFLPVMQPITGYRTTCMTLPQSCVGPLLSDLTWWWWLLIHSPLTCTSLCIDMVFLGWPLYLYSAQCMLGVFC